MAAVCLSLCIYIVRYYDDNQFSSHIMPRADRLSARGTVRGGIREDLTRSACRQLQIICYTIRTRTGRMGLLAAPGVRWRISMAVCYPGRLRGKRCRSQNARQAGCLYSPKTALALDLAVCRGSERAVAQERLSKRPPERFFLCMVEKRAKKR